MIKIVNRICGLLICFSLLSLGAQTQSKGRTYTISPSESSLWVLVGKSGIFSALGHDHEIGVKSFTGRVHVSDGGASSSSLELDVDAKSLTVLDKKVSEEDRTEIFNAMHQEVLESAKYQKITFKSVSFDNMKQTGDNNYSFTLNGDLTLHGVTKRVAIPVTATMTPEQLRANGKYTLKQSDFGIKPYSAGGGTVKVKNDVVVNFNIVAKA